MRPTVIVVLLLAAGAAFAQGPGRTGFVAGAEVGLGTDSFRWEEQSPSDYLVDTLPMAVLGGVSAGVWVSPSFRLLAQVPGAALFGGGEPSLPAAVFALYPGVQVSYHFPDVPYYLLASAGWVWTFNTDDEARASSVSGPVFGGGAGYWFTPHMSIQAESRFSSVRTNLDGARTTVNHLIFSASLCWFR